MSIPGGELEEQKKPETPPLVSDLIAAYDAFSALQQQKLRMAAYVLDMQAVIDDPAAAARSVLLERYSHIDEGKVDEVLALAVPHFGLADDEEGGRGVLTFSADWKETVQKSDDILPDGYGRACLLTYMQQYLAHQHGGGDAEDLRASLFTGLIADFESFLVGLLTALYSDQPQKLASKERSVSWHQVFSITNVDDFHEELIDQAVVDIMRGSFEDWMAALKKDHGVGVEMYTKSPAVVEMFQRRHVLVHNGGIASRLYVEKAPTFKVQRGDKLAVDQEYFQRAADKLAVVALGLTVNALLVAAKEDQFGVETRMTNWVYELLLRRRYQAVHDYLAEVPFDRMANHSCREVCRSNLWLALKRLERFDECRADVEAWQVRHLGDKFQLAKHALLGEMGEAVILCRAMREGGRLPMRHWVEWPVLEEVRVYEEQAGVQVPEEQDLGSDTLTEQEDAPDGGPADEH